MSSYLALDFLNIVPSPASSSLSIYLHFWLSPRRAKKTLEERRTLPVSILSFVAFSIFGFPVVFSCYCCCLQKTVTFRSVPSLDPGCRARSHLWWYSVRALSSSTKWPSYDYKRCRREKVEPSLLFRSANSNQHFQHLLLFGPMQCLACRFTAECIFAMYFPRSGKKIKAKGSLFRSNNELRPIWGHPSTSVAISTSRTFCQDCTNSSGTCVEDGAKMN